MLIKDCEYWEDKLSMGHMALSYIVQYDDSEKNHIVFKLGRQQESDQGAVGISIDDVGEIASPFFHSQ